MAAFWTRLLSLLGLGNGRTKERKTLEQRLGQLPRLSDWVVDTHHSSLQFRVMHMGLVEVRGFFQKWDARFNGTSPDFSDFSVEVELDINSIQTGNETRDAHLRSAEFLDAATYPKACFKSTRVEWRPLRTFILHGNLTLKDKTHPVTLQGELKSFILKDLFGQPRVAFELRGSIDRRLWGLTWQLELEGGELTVDNFVQLEVYAEITTPQSIAGLQQMAASLGGTI